jgi:hypothetical protein
MSQTQERSLRIRPFSGASLNDITGSSGEIFYDSTNQSLRIFSGGNPGGTLLATQDYVNSIAGTQNTFSSIAVQGQTTVTADAESDTLTLVANQGITITTNSSTDTITVGLSGSVVVQGGALGTPSSGNLINCTFPILNQNTTGSAGSATTAGSAGSAATLTTARNINGVSFNGSSDITVTAAAGTVTGNTLNSTVVNSNLTSVGSLTDLEVTGDVTANSNVIIEQIPTSVNHATNKKYVDARAAAMGVALS